MAIGYFAFASEKPADSREKFKQDMKAAGKNLKNAAGDLRDKAKEDIEKIKEKAEKDLKKAKGKTEITFIDKIKIKTGWNRAKEKASEGWVRFRKVIGLDS